MNLWRKKVNPGNLGRALQGEVQKSCSWFSSSCL